MQRNLIHSLTSTGLIHEALADKISENDDVKHNIDFIQALCKVSDHVNEYEIARSLSRFHQVPFFDLSHFDKNQLDPDKLNEKLVNKHQCLPIFTRGRTQYLATVNPQNYTALEDFQFSTGMGAEFICVEASKLGQLIEAAFEHDDGLGLDDFDEEELTGVEVSEDKTQDDDAGDGQDDAPIVVYINKILLDAIKKGASDLHFEPYEHKYRIRFRIDGVLHEIASPPVNLSSRLAARLKVMSRLDIAEKRKPQDGRIKLKISKKKSIDFRVSSLPTMWGEKIVMRILDSSSAMLGIDVLGYEPQQKQLYMNALEQPQGMILVTGPTGSGKTVSLYTGLNILNTTERNISTAEDPVEINLEGINQVQINVKADLTFANALRSFLRQDPDIVMVGEIRDLETAEIAIKAAQTGHLVMSTLHTNSAAETLTRLLNMGVQAFNIASSVSLIIAQRLARRLCKHCKQPVDQMPPHDELLEFGFSESQINADLQLFKPVGCDLCSGGYKGRVGIYEVMPITPSIAKLIMDHGNSIEIAAQATKEGVNDLRRSGILKAMSGVTSLEEVARVTNH
ncbi:type IV-A pilus assembly ATPase PilB [Saccharobesus litoralis]|uniref:Type IV-A pilus assembly ATPase PilB n=1 Tax=Saccharobesus litoralis TaxID=2172099 RepID=A0A2S0VWW6_9ALTE|nr:type IV-A pilus assembly ATPase PilB [Saccharobesus litoralis]AWB68714.1 type IV-A pilus assembly ATPase PilB [Saccharobesus litoralis]